MRSGLSALNQSMQTTAQKRGHTGDGELTPPVGQRCPSDTQGEGCGAVAGHGVDHGSALHRQPPTASEHGHGFAVEDDDVRRDGCRPGAAPVLALLAHLDGPHAVVVSHAGAAHAGTFGGLPACG